MIKNVNIFSSDFSLILKLNLKPSSKKTTLILCWFKETAIFTLMIKKLNLLAFIGILAVSCGGNDFSFTKEKKKYSISIVDFNTLLTEEENDVSFLLLSIKC